MHANYHQFEDLEMNLQLCFHLADENRHKIEWLHRFFRTITSGLDQGRLLSLITPFARPSCTKLSTSANL